MLYTMYKLAVCISNYIHYNNQKWEISISSRVLIVKILTNE